MKLWKIERFDAVDYDQYDAAVVVAETEEAARHMHPDKDYTWNGTEWGRMTVARGWVSEGQYGTWALPRAVFVTELADAPPGTPAGVVLASFNAG